MKSAGIRFSNDEYLCVNVTDEGIELYTIDAEGNKTEYTVTEKNRKKASAKAGKDGE